MAGAEGFEPSALGFGDRCSDQTELRPYRPKPNSTQPVRSRRDRLRIPHVWRQTCGTGGKEGRVWRQKGAMAADDLPVLIVGDVHGDIERLFQALKPYPADEWHTIFLGDLVDYGMFGVGALRFAHDRPTRPSSSAITRWHCSGRCATQRDSAGGYRSAAIATTLTKLRTTSRSRNGSAAGPR